MGNKVVWKVLPYLDQLAPRFWERVVQKEGCWDWTGYRSSYGYGRISLYLKWENRENRKRYFPAHRVAYAVHTGQEPGEVIRHLCHNRICTREDHLATGTASDNRRDSSLLTEEMVQELRQRVFPVIEFGGQTIRLSPIRGDWDKVAKVLGVPKSTLLNIAQNRSWQGVE